MLDVEVLESPCKPDCGDNMWWWHPSGCDRWSLAPLWRQPGPNPTFVTLTELIRPELWGMCDAVTVMKNWPDLCFNDLRTSWKIHKNEFWIRGVVSFTTRSKSDWVLRRDWFSRNSISTIPPFNITSSVPGTDINPDNYQGLMLESVVNGSLSLTCDCVTVNRSLWAIVTRPGGIMVTWGSLLSGQ